VTPVDDNNNSDEALSHETFIRTMNRIAEKAPAGSVEQQLAEFAAEVLESCGHTPALRKFLDGKANGYLNGPQ